MLERVLFTSDVVYNGVGLPLENAAVLVTKESSLDTGTVVTFGKLAELCLLYPDARVEPLGKAILPKPVNAHTHLDLSNVAFKAAPYTPWIGYVISQRELRGLAAAEHGLKILTSNTSVFGDIVARAEVMPFLLSQEGVSGVAYWEVLGADPSQADQILQDTIEKIREWRKLERPGGIRVGLSPHTAHTVSSILMKKLVAFAKLEGLPLQIHIAESPSELEMFQTGSGVLAQGISRVFDLPLNRILGREPGLDLTPVNHLEQLGVLEAKPTLIHAVNVLESDVQAIAKAGCTVVTCPRSNKNLECGVFPWQLFARYGVEVALGTDSVASGETLNIYHEALAALEIHGSSLGWRSIVRYVSRGGYKALGMKTPTVHRGDSFSSLSVWK
jgi:cytosine/adenosine deaminase-related metal-dependent hydrolase